MKVKEYVPALGAVLLAALLLTAVSFALRGMQEERSRAALEQQLTLLLPGSTDFTHRSGDGHLVQALYEGQTGTVARVRCPGYVYDVELLVAVGEEGTVTGLTVWDARETLGLGSDILTDHTFLAQFLTTDGTAEVGEEIRPISGATVSSRAVSRCVGAAVSAITGVDVPSQATPWGDAP